MDLPRVGLGLAMRPADLRALTKVKRSADQRRVKIERKWYVDQKSILNDGSGDVNFPAALCCRIRTWYVEMLVSVIVAGVGWANFGH